MIKTILKSLKRDTLSTKFIPEIDGMRFFAIITVVIYHLNTAYSRSINLELNDVYNILNDSSYFGIGWWIKRLDIGVKIFFVISGFILAIPFIKYYLGEGKKIILKSYFIRRLTRLEPPYLVSLLLLLFVHYFILSGDFEQLSKSFILGVFYLHNIVMGVPNPINPVTWSLETEAQFYILIPLLLSFLFLYKNKRWVYITFFILFVATIFSKYYFMSIGNGHLNTSILVYIINFLIGIFLAYLYLKYTSFFKAKSFLWDLINLTSIFLMFYFYKPQANILNIVMLNFGMFLFFISVFKSKLFNWFYTQPIIYTIGGMCYSIYLLHYAFFHLSIKLTSKLMIFDNYLGNLIVQLLINLPLVLIISVIFFTLIEKPCMNKDWLRNLKLRFVTEKSIKNVE